VASPLDDQSSTRNIVSSLLVVQEYFVFPASVVMSKVSGEATLSSKISAATGIPIDGLRRESCYSAFLKGIYSCGIEQLARD